MGNGYVEDAPASAVVGDCRRDRKCGGFPCILRYHFLASRPNRFGPTLPVGETNATVNAEVAESKFSLAQLLPRSEHTKDCAPLRRAGMADGSERGSVENVNSRPTRHGSGLFVAGIILAVFGGIGVAAEANNHAVCDSTLGQLAQFDQNIRDSCSTDNALFYVGIVALVAGSVLLVVGSIRLSRPPRPASARQGPFPGQPGPGWYPSPGRSGYVRWWDGIGWTEQEYVQAVPPPTPPPPKPPPPTPTSPWPMAPPPTSPPPPTVD